MGPDCKSGGTAFGGSNPPTSTKYKNNQELTRMDQMTRTLLGLLNYVPGKRPAKEIDYAVKIIERAKQTTYAEVLILSTAYDGGILENNKLSLNLLRDRYLAKGCLKGKPEFWVITPKGVLLYQAAKAYMEYIDEHES